MQMNFICLEHGTLLSYIQCCTNILQKEGEGTSNFENIALLSKGFLRKHSHCPKILVHYITGTVHCLIQRPLRFDFFYLS